MRAEAQRTKQIWKQKVIYLIYITYNLRGAISKISIHRHGMKGKERHILSQDSGELSYPRFVILVAGLWGG